MDAKKDAIQVLMMGARRAGKTSALSAMYSIINSPALKEYLTINDVSSNCDAATSLSQKKEDMVNTLQHCIGKTILMNDNGTSNYMDYTLKIDIPDNGGSLKITFTDANGEFYAQGDIHTEDVRKKISSYDIIVIAIDTPFLMEMYNPDNKLCTQSVGRAYNQIDNIHTLLASIDDNEGRNAKLVFFTPIKCERWINHGLMDEVYERVKKAYDTPIKALCSYKNIEVVILPLVTIGGIEFESHRKALLLSRSDGTVVSCSQKDDNTLILNDGTTYHPTATDKINPDPKATIEGFSCIIRPNSWYRVVSETYSPRNCDQLAYYVLQFALVKSVHLKNQIQEKRHDRQWWHVPLATILIFSGFGVAGAGLLAAHFISKRLGSVKTDKLQATINKMKANGIFKINAEGITIINKGLLVE